MSRRTVGCPHCLPGPQNPTAAEYGWQAGFVPEPSQRQALNADGEVVPAVRPDDTAYAIPWRPCLCHPDHKPWLDGDRDNSATVTIPNRNPTLRVV